MVNMIRKPKKTKRNTTMEVPYDERERYPYGLQINLESEELKKLDMDSLDGIDWDKLKIEAMLSNAEAAVEMMEKNGMKSPPSQLSQPDRILIDKVMKEMGYALTDNCDWSWIATREFSLGELIDAG